MEKPPSDYVGPVGHEKTTHPTHWQMTNKPKLRKTEDTEYEWVEIKPLIWKRVKKENKHG